MANPLRIGIIGTSFVSDWICEASQMSENCEITAVYSRDLARGSAYAEKQCIGGCFDDEESFFSSDRFDAVYVASPNILHYRQTLDALNHGKHVLCEKPLSINAAQAERMIHLAHEKGLILLEAIRPVHDPFLSALQENLHKVGRIRRATFEFCQYSSRYDRPGVLSMGCQTKSESTVHAIEAIVAEARKMTTEEVTDEELELAKDSYLNSFVFNFDSTAEIISRLMTYDYYGYPPDFLQKTKESIEKVTKADVLRAARAHLRPDAMQILVVGRPEDFDRPLSTLGEVRSIDVTIPTPGK